MQTTQGSRRAKRHEQVVAAIVRWERKLKLAATKLTKLGQEKRRLEKAIERDAVTKPAEGVRGGWQPPAGGKKPAAPTTGSGVATPPPPTVIAKVQHSDGTASDITVEAIPGFLRRTPVVERGVLRASPLTPEAQKILDEKAEHRKAKAKGQAERRKAKDSGALKKMPLTGRAALDAIRAK